ncbi:TerD family protein [Streptomyces sp. NPDC015220]|uniref:TerD family protein n=1 Tax=Streptomyces sp. NPDC015220 TaxID=3364947 RepID=UPI0036F69B78
MTNITKGANVPVPAGALRVAVCRLSVPGTPLVDASALLLDAGGKVRGDADLVFYNQPAHPSGAVRHTGAGQGGGMLAEWLEVDLPRVEPGMQRVLIAGSCDGGVFGQVPGLYVQVLTAEGAVVAHYTVTDATSETAFVLGEFYRRNGLWKFRAVGQGYDSGLAGLATDFGIAVQDGRSGSEPVAPAVPPAAAPVPNTAVSKTAGLPPSSAGPVPQAVPGPPAHPAPAPVAPAAAMVPDRLPIGTDFVPHVQSGFGNGVVAVEAPLPPGPVIVEARIEGDDYLLVETLDRRNKKDDIVFNTELPDFHGRALVQPPQGRPLRLNVDYPGAWTITVLPLSSARRLGTRELTGRGADVVAYTGAAADVTVRFDGGADRGQWFLMNCHEAAHLDDLDRHDMLVNETGRLAQTVPVPDGPLLLVVENAEGDWGLTARPLPVHTPSTDQETGEAPRTPAPDGKGGTGLRALFKGRPTSVYEGRGEKTITLVNPWPGRPALVRYDFPRAEADYRLEVKNVDEYGDESEWLTGGECGTRGVSVAFRAGQAEQTVRVRHTGEWTLRLLPEEEAPLLTGPVEGKGSAVLRYQGPPTLMTVRRTSLGKDERLVALSLNHPYGKWTNIADTNRRRRPVLGPVWVDPGGSCFVVVKAVQGTKWRLEPEPLSAAPVLGARTHGGWYGVVRHDGPERELVIAGSSGVIHVFELDENLFPYRKITASSGPYRISSSLLHVRSLGDWTLELRD